MDLPLPAGVMETNKSEGQRNAIRTDDKYRNMSESSGSQSSDEESDIDDKKDEDH